MATGKSDQFDRVDWDEFADSSGFSLTINTKAMFVCTIPLVALVLYDRWFVGEREATFEELGADLNLTWLFEALGMNYDPSGLDYIFVFTIFLFLFYLILPLYQNPRMTKYYWKEFKRNRPAVVSLWWLFVIFVGGILGPLVMSAPESNIMTGYQPPAFMSIDTVHVASCVGEVQGSSCYGTWEYPLGTTPNGQSVLTVLVYGMTVSMKIGFIVTTIVAAIGITFGTVSAFAGGWVDEIMMRFVDIVLSLPTLIIYLLILYIYGADLAMFILVFAALGWGGTSRYVRSKALSVTEEEFIKATKISGASTFRIVRQHIVPNTASSIITQLTLLIPIFLLAEAQLAFLGIGESGLHSWGQLISAGRDSLSYAPWITLAPGIVLFLTILAFNFLGDALLDAVNPEAEAEADR